MERPKIEVGFKGHDLEERPSAGLKVCKKCGLMITNEHFKDFIQGRPSGKHIPVCDKA